MFIVKRLLYYINVYCLDVMLDFHLLICESGGLLYKELNVFLFIVGRSYYVTVSTMSLFPLA